jgi:hypothetical protein
MRLVSLWAESVQALEVIVRSRRRTRIAVLGLTVLAVGAGLLASVVALTAQRGLLQLDVMSAGWPMPVVAILVVAGVALLLLGETPRRDMGSRGSRSADSCPDCGREVGEGWRLCPWCGYRKQLRERSAYGARTEES